MTDATRVPPQGRPTLYCGIPMRSRLEADFAQRVLDADLHSGEEWEYEPCCFASKRGQYLPDFRMDLADGKRIYWEVKPITLLEQEDRRDIIDSLLDQMTIIWESEPAVALMLIFWPYGGTIGRSCHFLTNGVERNWRVALPGSPDWVTWGPVKGGC